MNTKRVTGVYEMINGINYFIPYPLPPHNPPFAINEEITSLYGAAMNQLGQLNEITNRLPNQKRFIKAYVIKEALLSSAIEGIHTTLLDVFTQPISGVQINKETQLVLNYTKALEIACSMVKKDGLPIASRVILKAHKELMHLENDSNKANPGHYRQLPVRVGNLIPTYASKFQILWHNLLNLLIKIMHYHHSLKQVLPMFNSRQFILF
jgi:Fic family protein